MPDQMSFEEAATIVAEYAARTTKPGSRFRNAATVILRRSNEEKEEFRRFEERNEGTTDVDK